MIEGLVLPISCFEEQGIISLDDNSIDHVITDPPYEEHVHADNRRSQSRDGIVIPHMSFDSLSDEERWAAAQEFVRVSRGWVHVFCSLEQAGLWSHDLVRAGAKRRTTNTWVKTNCAPKFQGDGSGQGCEAIVTAWAGQGKSVWNSGGMNGTYQAMAERAGRRHPTQKPLALMMQLLADYTKPGDLILDAYAGGGQTLVAAKRLGRRYAGYELNPDTALTAQEAIEAAVEDEVHILPRLSEAKRAAWIAKLDARAQAHWAAQAEQERKDREVYAHAILAGKAVRRAPVLRLVRAA